MEKILLSIGIIFKNEVRCLERCLKSLQPLRDAVPSELIMADTGSDDGSRQIAERYADIVFDFPWVNDFSAARNAVMDRCCGIWYLTIDCDEWLDQDINGLVNFLCGEQQQCDAGAIIQRNYMTLELERGNDYNDFMAVRLLRMSTGIRYNGTIHEFWPFRKGKKTKTIMIENPIFHHDGYAYEDKEKMHEKSERNMCLLRKELETDPKNLKILMQCIESSDNSDEKLEYARRGIKVVEEKHDGWVDFGPPVFRYAVMFATNCDSPEADEWIKRAKELFPNSIYTRVDVEYFAFARSMKQSNFIACIQRSECYFKAIQDYEKGHFDQKELMISSLTRCSHKWRMQMLASVSVAYLNVKQMEKVAEALGKLDVTHMDSKLVGICTSTYYHLHSRCDIDLEESLLRFWNQINQPVPSEKQARERRSAFIQAGSATFAPAYLKNECQQSGFKHHGYTIFLPLAGTCELGNAAQILETDSPDVMVESLRTVQSWDVLPASALARALERDVEFPLQDKPMYMEEMDGLAERLSTLGETFDCIVDRAPISGDEQTLGWSRALLLSAVQTCDWKDKERGMALARKFAELEKAFLPICYAPLNEERLRLLPPMHRFGWWCIQAFDALDANDSVEYVRMLRKALVASPEMKEMIEFLMKHTKNIQDVATPSPELLDLADQVRTILSRYDPQDPAVVALKASPAYQRVAYLLGEGL